MCVRFFFILLICHCLTEWIVLCLYFYLCSVFGLVFWVCVLFFCNISFSSGGFLLCPLHFFSVSTLLQVETVHKKRFVLDLEWFQWISISFKFLGFWNSMPFYNWRKISSSPSIQINVLHHTLLYIQMKCAVPWYTRFFLLLFYFIIKFLSGAISRFQNFTF